MNPDDQNDIINKVKSSGNDEGEEEDNNEPDGDNESNPTNDMDSAPSGDFDFSGGGDTTGGLGGEMNEVVSAECTGDPDPEVFEFVAKKNNMFQPNSNDILKDNDLYESKKNRIFSKSTLLEKLQESFQQDDMTTVTPEPTTKPAPQVKPTEPERKSPSRKQRPFLPEVTPQIQPQPKAVEEEIGQEQGQELTAEPAPVSNEPSDGSTKAKKKKDPVPVPDNPKTIGFAKELAATSKNVEDMLEKLPALIKVKAITDAMDAAAIVAQATALIKNR